MAASPPVSRGKSVWKGKEKATEQDFDDLNPTITYRHILQQNLGIRDPLRVVALCDSDAFYAACEMVRLGVKDKPLVVLQWEGIIAVNYPAREFGITRFHKLSDAKERCPHLMIIHVATYKEGEAEPGYWDNVDSRTHKVSLDYYRRESAKVLTMFKEGLPDVEIEKASIDEAFMDFTKVVRQELLQRYPYLATVPPDAPNGLDSPLPAPPKIELSNYSHVIPTEDDKDHELTWHDVALSIAAEMMNKVRVDVSEKLGYTTSAGLARNKFLAKLSASYKKPYSQSVLRNCAIPSYLKPMPFQKIRFLGGKLGEALAKEYDVSTVQDLLGIDRTEVKEKSILNKSMLASKNLQKPITKVADGPHWIRVLAAELALRLNDARKENQHLWPKTLVLHARQGYEVSRSKQAPFPFSRDVTVDLIAHGGNKLWTELVGNHTGAMKVTNISLAFTGIETAEEGQQNIDGFFRAGGQASKRPRENDAQEPDERQGTSAHNESDDSAVFFTCSRCRKRISLSSGRIFGKTDEEKNQALDALKAEHEDFHFAQAVAREVEPEPETHTTSEKSIRPGSAKKRKKKETGPAKGIEKFFSRK
ncbi:N-acetyltransferase eso1 [Marasmius crinis-equi]|uniref:DNA polymerase eta n=1 Tax=Marasmius crinis-equi TaxID=585013 RepID=A0ABR3FAM5_9AGAR